MGTCECIRSDTQKGAAVCGCRYNAGFGGHPYSPSRIQDSVLARQMPDGYIGWVHRLQIARMSAKELADWNASRRVVVTARFTTLTSENGATLARLPPVASFGLSKSRATGFWYSCGRSFQVFFELLMSRKQTRISPFVTDCEGKNLGLSLGSCLAPLSNFSEHRTFGEE